MTRDEVLDFLNIAKEKIDPRFRINLVLSALCDYFEDDKEIFNAIINAAHGTKSARKTHKKLVALQEEK